MIGGALAVMPTLAIPGRRHQISTMARTHPHAEATYRVIPLGDGSFGVEVSIPETYPTTVRPFGTEIDAEAWIARHKDQVQTHATTNGWFRKPRGGKRGP